MKIPREYIEFSKEFFRKKFVKDSVWLLASQIVLAVCGFSLNILITKYYGISTFGSFSIAFKIYLIASIFSSFGISVSALKYSAQYAGNPEMLNKSISAAMMFVIVSSLLVTLLAIFLIPAFSFFFNDNSLNGLLLVFFSALPFYSLNKVLALVLNGQRDIIALSVTQILRWILLIVVISIVIFLLHFELTVALLAFPATEFLLLVPTWIYSKKYFSFSFRNEKKWLLEHFSFGGKSMFSYGISDINNYLDVFIIGYFTGNRMVGIYSFASDITKNLIVVADIFLANFNPIIATFYSTKQLKELKKLIKKIRNITYLIYIPLIISAIAVYFLIIKFIGAELEESMLPFIILSIGTFFLSGFKPFNAILELAGFPGTKLKMNILIIVVNFLLLLVFINIWGINGVALATTLSYIVSVFLLHWFSVKKLNISLMR